MPSWARFLLLIKLEAACIRNWESKNTMASFKKVVSEAISMGNH